MDSDQFKSLLDKYKEGKATKEEIDFLNAYYKAFELRPDFSSDSDDSQYERLWGDIKTEIDKRIVKQQGKPSTKLRLWSHIAAAASIILCIGLGFYFYHHHSATAYNLVKQDILPGRNRATLALANGEKIDLDAIKKGTIIHQNGLTITKTNDDQLVYEASVVKNESSHSEPSYNTIETPRGGRYAIKLPDGTSVWLNAASSLKYPIQFTRNERRVTLTGEGYFEVVHDKTRPFRVESHGQVVEVIGTHFNITAYADERLTKTTLLEGAVKITGHAGMRVLKPGQQAEASSSGIVLADGVDIEEVVSWKNGDFKFNESLESIMAKIARWYDIEVIYETPPNPNLTFTGKISRARNISDILNMLSYNGDVHFKVEGRRVTVTK